MSKIKYFSENQDVQNKTIILRLDLNVPLKKKKFKIKVEFLQSCLFKKLNTKKSKNNYYQPFG